MVRCVSLSPVSPILLTFNFGLELLARSPSQRVLPALVVTLAFGLFGFLLRGVTKGGAVAGTLTSFAIYLGLGLGGFVTLAGVFAITLLTTRLGYYRKLQLGLAESSTGRTAGQVFANLSAAAVFAVLAIKAQLFALAAVAAIAEAAADTAQSEIGEIVSHRSWLITSFRQVPAGTDGGITFPGSLAGAVAVCTIVALAAVTHVIAPNRTWIAGIAGFFGTIVDSLLGATFERRGWLNNNGVNFLSTLASGATAIAISLFVHQ